MTITRIDTCPVCKGNHLIHKLSCVDNVSGQTFEILQCIDCGLHITQQPPHLKDMVQYYPAADAACYKPAKGWGEKWCEHLRASWNKQQTQIVVREAARYSGVLFELGSKQGYFANTMRNAGWIVHTVEGDETAREYGNKRFLLQSEDVTRFYDIKPCSYNVAVAWDTLGEAFDVHRALTKLSQLIVSDGTLIVAFHDASSHDATHYGVHWQGWNVPRKRWHFTPKAFEMLAQNVGLEVVARNLSSRRAFMTALASRWYTSGKKNVVKSAIDSFVNVQRGGRDTYYIYTLKLK